MDEAEQCLWTQWSTQHDVEARNALVVMHAAWARLVARDVYLRVGMRHADWADLVQNATVGLIEAVERFDPALGVDFRVYARHRVRGAVFNGLRHLMPTARRAAPGAASAQDRVQSLAEDAPDDSVDAFIALTLGLGVGFILDAQSMPTPDELSSGPYAHVEQGQTSALAREAVDALPGREREIVVLHYYQHLPFVEIAGMFGISKGRVSQLHRQALGRMRAVLHPIREALPC